MSEGSAADNLRNDLSRLFTFSSRREALPWVLMVVILLLMITVLSIEGRVWWCNWDTPIYLVTADAWSKHTSQHLFDPYSLTHFLHGFLFLWVLDLFVHRILRLKISFAWLLLWAFLAEASWEVVENSPFIIERYREGTASLDYFGDSITNSVGDIVSCSAGFITAYKLRFRLSLVLFVLIELFLILTIRDSLLINIIMLLYTVEAIKVWQLG